MLRDLCTPVVAHTCMHTHTHAHTYSHLLDSNIHVARNELRDGISFCRSNGVEGVGVAAKIEAKAGGSGCPPSNRVKGPHLKDLQKHVKRPAWRYVPVVTCVHVCACVCVCMWYVCVCVCVHVVCVRVCVCVHV